MNDQPSIILRCSKCGYRRHDAEITRCSECGELGQPLQPLDRYSIRRGLIRLILIATGGWVFFILPVLIANLAVKMSDGIPIYMTAIMCGMPSPIFYLAWAFVVTSYWNHWFLHAIWSVYDGETGPWSRTSVRARVFVILLLAQLTVATVVGLICTLLFPDWPAGWP